MLPWILVGIGTVLAVRSLWEALWAKGVTAPRKPGGVPYRAAVVVPVKGYDHRLKENLAALASQDYPDFELIVTCRAAGDLPDGVVPDKARIVYAGEPPAATSEKIGNLLAAVRVADPGSEVFVFADSDGRAGRNWLRSLVAALEEPGVGAATGYRWHVPARPDFPSLLRSVWNAVIAGSLRGKEAAFCWGGAMAIRRNTWEKLDIPAWWLGTISDDYRLAQAVRHAGLRIAFVPEALVAAEDRTGLGDLVGWATRQMRITRFYQPRLWRLALFAHVVYCGSMVAAVWLAAHGSWMAALLLIIQLGIGFYLAWGRVAFAARWMPEHREWFWRYHPAHLALTPVGTWLWLVACVGAGLGNAIEWRGYTYRLRKPPVPVIR